MPSTPHKDEHAALATALDHVWRWQELRHQQAAQVINFFMVAAAVMATGYVSALTSKLYVAAGILGLLGVLVSVVVYLVVRRLHTIERIAEEPMTALQDRLATALNIDSLRMTSVLQKSPGPLGTRVTHLHGVVTGLAMLLGLAAVLYAWLGH